MPADDYESLKRQIQDAGRDLNQTMLNKHLAATITAGMVDVRTTPQAAVEKFWEVFNFLSPQDDT